LLTFRLLSERNLDAWGRKCEKTGVKTPKPREWTDAKTGRTYWRVRWNGSDGREYVKVFGTPEAAEDHVKVILKEREIHGRAAAVSTDEIDALSIWRKFVADETTEGRDAPALRDVIRQTIERMKCGSTTPAISVLQDRFIDAKERQEVSPRHLAALKNRVARFVSYFDKATPAGEVTTDEVARAMATMRAGGLSPQTVKGIRTAAHGLFAWAMDCGLVSSNPITRAKSPKVTVAEVGVITASQLKGLLKTTLEIEPRAVPALAVWAFCGVRRAELTRLRFEDIDTARKELRISAKAAKSGVARFVPCPPALMAWLAAAESKGIAPIGKIVPGGMKLNDAGEKIPDDSEAKSEGQLNRWLRDIRPKAGLNDWPNNALRHGFASCAAAVHDDFSKVAAWLGHARDPRLLVARYRHAVRQKEGAAWFNVLPVDKPAKKTAKKAAKKTTTRQSA